MKRVVSILAAVPLLCATGCYTNRGMTVRDDHLLGVVHASFMAPTEQRARFPVTRTQVRFLRPEGMEIGWQIAEGTTAAFAEGQITVPGRYNFEQGAIYRLKLTNIPDRDGLVVYPTLEVAPATPETAAYLAHNAVPVEFTDEDFDQVEAGNYVTKVIYLPDPEHQELAIAGVETLVSTRLGPGVDPIAEAERRGSILVVIRMGSIDLELPHSSPVYSQTQVVADHGVMPATVEEAEGAAQKERNAVHVSRPSTGK